jgi:hypothetical protein
MERMIWATLRNGVPRNGRRHAPPNRRVAHETQRQFITPNFRVPFDQSGPDTNFGIFKMDGAAHLTFTAAGAAPEPSTYAAVLFGGATMLLSRRCRTA